MTDDRIEAVRAALTEFLGYDKHGGADDTLTSARLLARAVTAALTAYEAAKGGERDAVIEECAKVEELVRDLHSSASKLLATFDELRSITAAERIITGRSDAVLRKESSEAIEALRAAVTKAALRMEGK